MGELHQLLLAHGLAHTSALDSALHHKRTVAVAHAVMADERQRISAIHAGFAMTALPHKCVDTPVWIRDYNNVKLVVESGRDETGRHVGLPYGAAARIILFYLQSEAARTQSRTVHLGRSLNAWLTAMGLDDGGNNFRIVRDQASRVASCRLTFHSRTSTGRYRESGAFVGAEHTLDTNAAEGWSSTVLLDEGFYQSLIEHPLPLQEAAIQQLSRSSLAIDVYVWLAYRLHVLNEPTPISWQSLHAQFGSYKDVRFFRRGFLPPLALALAAYPDAQVEQSENGLVLHPSPPPVRKREAAG